MACEICGRGNCTRSFHSIESQNEFDFQADAVKERARNNISNAVNRIDNGTYIDDEYYIKLEDAIKIIDNYY